MFLLFRGQIFQSWIQKKKSTKKKIHSQRVC